MARASYLVSGVVLVAEEKHFLYIPWMSYKMGKGVEKKE
jgi:hypothetical protein